MSSDSDFIMSGQPCVVGAKPKPTEPDAFIAELARVVSQSPDGTTSSNVAVFTDDAQAETFIENAGAGGRMQVHPMPDPETFIGLLELLKDKGESRVAIDPGTKRVGTIEIPELVGRLRESAG